MRVYTGQTRSRRAIALCERFGLGECTNRGELPPRRTASGWFLDCGSFVDWKAGRPFDFVRWDRDLRYVAYRLEAGKLQAPDFIVMPDLVGGGAASLIRSMEELASVPPELPVRYLVVQEGMTTAQVAEVLPHFGGIFVGGASMAWKLGSAPGWIELAHAHGRRCHIGRIGTLARLELAQRMGADSCDSCQPLWTLDRLEAFGLAASRAGERRAA
ncbi:MAG: hypothetical protein ACREBE_00030 [bacterium]